MKIYLAAPFFNPAQVAVVEKIEKLLTDTSVQFYSPRKDGVLASMNPEERRSSTRRIFDRNCEMMDWADTIWAVIDDRDAGVMFELGYCFRAKKTIVTYTEKNYGLNVMIQEATVAHLKGIEKAEEFLYRMISGDVDAYSKFRDFNENVT